MWMNRLKVLHQRCFTRPLRLFCVTLQVLWVESLTTLQVINHMGLNSHPDDKRKGEKKGGEAVVAMCTYPRGLIWFVRKKWSQQTQKKPICESRTLSVAFECCFLVPCRLFSARNTKQNRKDFVHIRFCYYLLTTNTPLGAAPASLFGNRSHTDW